MMLSFTSDQWVIVALVFVLGLVVGGFLFSGGGRKWKQRYNVETDRRKELEATHATREKEWRQQETAHAAAIKEHERALAARPVAVAPIASTTTRDVNRDGVVDSNEAVARPNLVDRVLGRDPVAPRTATDTIPVVDRNNDGVIDDRDR